MDKTLAEEFDFYRKNQEALVREYEGKFVVIKGKKVLGVYSTEIEAYVEGQKISELGTFLIQKVEKGAGNYSQTFYSRVSV